MENIFEDINKYDIDKLMDIIWYIYGYMAKVKEHDNFYALDETHIKSLRKIKLAFSDYFKEKS